MANYHSSEILGITLFLLYLASIKFRDYREI